MIELAQETQKKAQDEFRAVHREKRKIIEKLGESLFKKLKKKWGVVLQEGIRLVYIVNCFVQKAKILLQMLL